MTTIDDLPIVLVLLLLAFIIFLIVIFTYIFDLFLISVGCIDWVRIVADIIFVIVLIGNSNRKRN